MTDTYTFYDVLIDKEIIFTYPEVLAYLEQTEEKEKKEYESVFFPGCAYLNFGLPIVEDMYNDLLKHDFVDSISFLCCGRPLSFTPTLVGQYGKVMDSLALLFIQSKIKRVVTACPNCTIVLRELFENYDELQDVEVVTAIELLTDLGYKLSQSDIDEFVGKENSIVVVHDSCPDKELGEFAYATRKILDGHYKEMIRNHQNSLCCGVLSKLRGNEELGNKNAIDNGIDAKKNDADMIVNACMSCPHHLNHYQDKVPACNIFEILYNKPIDWERTPVFMTCHLLANQFISKS